MSSPGFLKVKLGETTVEDSELSKTELLIEIPDSKALGKKAPASYMGGENGKLGEILLETTRPPLHSLRIRVRFAVPGGKSINYEKPYRGCARRWPDGSACCSS